MAGPPPGPAPADAPPPAGAVEVGVPGVGGPSAEEQVSVASNWTLVWWRFRKHRLALASAGVLGLLYLVVLVPDFFATQDPEATDARLAFIPVQRLRLFDGWAVRPWVPAVVGRRNPVTLRMEWTVDEFRSASSPAATRTACWGSSRPGSTSWVRPGRARNGSTCSAPTGSGATSGRGSCTGPARP